MEICRRGLQTLASHADVLRGSSRVPAKLEHVTIPKERLRGRLFKAWPWLLSFRFPFKNRGPFFMTLIRFVLHRAEIIIILLIAYSDLN